MFIKSRHLHLREVFPIILVVKMLDSQSRVTGWNLPGGFKIKVISVFHSIEVDKMSARNSTRLSVRK